MGEVAARFGFGTHVLRHWESLGLLAPARDSAGRRCYTEHDIARVAVIVRAKQAGLSLDRIAELLAVGGSHARTAILRRQRDELVTLIEAAQASLQLIECALGCKHDDLTNCTHFQAAILRTSSRQRKRMRASQPPPSSWCCCRRTQPPEDS